MFNTADGRLKLSMDGTYPPVIHASGELDHENCQELDRMMQNAIVQTGPSLELSLGGLNYVDSSGIRVLAVTAYRLKKTDGYLRLISVSPQLARLLSVSGFDRLFDMVSMPAPVTAAVPSIAAAVEDFSFAIATTADACCDAREKVCTFASCAGLRGTALDDIRLAVGEALANAVRHGAGPANKAEISCEAKDSCLTITMRYPSEPFDPETIPIPDIESAPSGGMGISFMRLVMDKVDYRFDDGCAVVVLKKQIEHDTSVGAR